MAKRSPKKNISAPNFKAAINHWVTKSDGSDWVSFISAIAGIATAAISLLNFAAGLFGGGNIANRRAQPNVWQKIQLEVDWPFQLVVFLILVAFVAWGFGFVLSHTTRRDEQHWHFGTYFLSFIWGIFIISTAKGLTNPSALAPSTQIHAFGILGVVVSLYLVVLQFKAHNRDNDVDIMEMRSRSVLIFASSAFAMLLLAGVSR